MAGQGDARSESRPLRGREKQARDNDRQILVAAAEVLAVNPDAPMSEIAARARVGQGSLYRRYRDRNELLRDLCATGMREAADLASSARESVRQLGSDGFVRFMHSYLDSPASMLLVLAGRVDPDDELITLADDVHDAIDKVIAESRRHGCLRAGITALDLELLITQLARRPLLGNPTRDRELAHRYLDLALHGLVQTGGPVTGDAPSREENLTQWRTRAPIRK
ncbi:TetR/AcrR family transcriptional regulator [Fodinicola acaciae]|uniref:TetR/AcrR family transcriptional regulator n=1 Tax=Fodinicola acaciae TaxID=2681555 RepID=UPI0013D8C71A|nr:TetR/AcrR family transcriptional regulator [Fodinicola acaciae]